MNLSYQKINEILRPVTSRLYQLKKEKAKISLHLSFIGSGTTLLQENILAYRFVEFVKSYLEKHPGQVDQLQVEFYKGEKARKPFENQILQISNRYKKPDITPERSSFHGLGEAEVNALVEKKWAEKVREQQFADMSERLSRQNQELSDANNTIDSLTAKVDELTGELESKKSIQYYATFLGDMLEGFGISKAEIAKKLGGLMGIKSTPGQKEVPQKSQDNSGIVEEPAPAKQKSRRDSQLELICEFLDRQGEQSLDKIFDVLSYIESDPRQADRILEYMKLPKTSEDADLPVYNPN